MALNPSLPLYSDTVGRHCTGPACTALIRHFEGCARRQQNENFAAYPDPATGADPWTIGWGSTGADIVEGLIWTQAQCDVRLETDVAAFASHVAKAIGDAATSHHQFDALVSFAYNIGLANLERSTLLKLHRAGDFIAAQKQFFGWNRGVGRVLPGLTRRRAAEAALYGTVDAAEAPALT